MRTPAIRVVSAVLVKSLIIAFALYRLKAVAARTVALIHYKWRLPLAGITLTIKSKSNDHIRVY